MRSVYRICHVCGREWNVSRLDPGGKKYVCPTCSLKEKIIKKEGTRCTSAPTVEKN